MERGRWRSHASSLPIPADAFSDPSRHTCTGPGGVEITSYGLLTDMTDHLAPSHPADALDELIDQLLNCGGVLSQIVGHMVKSQATGQAAPDAAPIPEAAHTVLRDALSDLVLRHRTDSLEMAARIVEEATNAICANVFLVPAAGTEGPTNGHLNRRARRARRRGTGG